MMARGHFFVLILASALFGPAAVDASSPGRARLRGSSPRKEAAVQELTNGTNSSEPEYDYDDAGDDEQDSSDDSLYSLAASEAFADSGAYDVLNSTEPGEAYYDYDSETDEDLNVTAPSKSILTVQQLKVVWQNSSNSSEPEDVDDYDEADNDDEDEDSSDSSLSMAAVKDFAGATENAAANFTEPGEMTYDYGDENDEVPNEISAVKLTLAVQGTGDVSQKGDDSTEPADGDDDGEDADAENSPVNNKDPEMDESPTSDWMPLGGAAHNVADDEGQVVGNPVEGFLGDCEDACDSTDGCESFAFCGDVCYLKDKAVRKGDAFHSNKHCTTYYRGENTDISCYNLFSSMAFNSLVQSFPNNPDSKAAGFSTCTLCTNGMLTCTALVYGGQTPLIASHIHLADNGDGENGSGPPVLSFCGDNSRGLINLDPPYPEMCAPYSSGSSSNPNMEGVLLKTPPNKGMTVAERVRDIAENTGRYYMNFHSIASWTYWSAQGAGPAGMCRGVMKLS